EVTDARVAVVDGQGERQGQAVQAGRHQDVLVQGVRAGVAGGGVGVARLGTGGRGGPNGDQVLLVEHGLDAAVGRSGRADQGERRGGTRDRRGPRSGPATPGRGPRTFLHPEQRFGGAPRRAPAWSLTGG